MLKVNYEHCYLQDGEIEDVSPPESKLKHRKKGGKGKKKKKLKKKGKFISCEVWNTNNQQTIYWKFKDNKWLLKHTKEWTGSRQD